MLNDLAVVDAVEIGGGELDFIARGRTAEEGAILRARPERAGHDLITFGYDVFDLAVIVAEPLQHCGKELLLPGDTRRQVRVMLDVVGSEIALSGLGLSFVDGIVDVVAD